MKQRYGKEGGREDAEGGDQTSRHAKSGVTAHLGIRGIPTMILFAGSRSARNIAAQPVS